MVGQRQRCQRLGIANAKWSLTPQPTSSCTAGDKRPVEGWSYIVTTLVDSKHKNRPSNKMTTCVENTQRDKRLGSYLNFGGHVLYYSTIAIAIFTSTALPGSRATSNTWAVTGAKPLPPPETTAGRLRYTCSPMHAGSRTSEGENFALWRTACGKSASSSTITSRLRLTSKVATMVSAAWQRTP